MSDSTTLDTDLDAIRALAEVLDETGLSEIEIERGPLRLRVAKGAVTVAAPAPVAAAASAAPAAPPPAAGSADPAGADLSSHPGAITSPMVGTAYLSPSPGSDPFVSVGTAVSAGQTVLIVEAMKTMNEIKAHKSGQITQIFARDAEPIEFGEVLMIIE